MVLFLGLLYILGLLTTVINFSMLKNWWQAALASFAVCAPVIIFYSFCASIGIIPPEKFLHDHGAIASFSLLLIVESFFMLVLSNRFVIQSLNGQKLNWTVLSLLPSLTLMLGNEAILTILFQIISGKSFLLIALLFSGFIFVILMTGRAAVKFLSASFDAKIKVKIFILFLQILLAMFLPLLASGIETIPVTVHFDLLFTLIITGGMTLVALAGFIIHHFISPEKGNRLCRFLIRVCT